MLRLKYWVLLMFAVQTVWGQESGQEPDPMRIGVVGLVHSHVNWILNRASDGDFELVGIAEPNMELAQRYLTRYNLPMSLVYPTIEEMLDAAKPEAVTAFNTIRGHLEVVELCAPRGIHVMVEKPLAASLGDALKMSRLARQHNIQLLTNYETTWYGSNHLAKEMLTGEPESFGDIRKIVVHDGHQGPKEIGVDPEFLEWLTDPYYNGAGALTDFGCYGANLSTWLHDGIMPNEVFCVTQQIKPDIYPNVDDEATIILTYDKSQTIIQASWNWNYSRKDIEIYGKTGFIKCLDRSNMRVMRTGTREDSTLQAPALDTPFDDPFRYFMAVVRGEVVPGPEDLSSIENNLIVMAILQGALTSARSGKKFVLQELEIE